MQGRRAGWGEGIPKAAERAARVKCRVPARCLAPGQRSLPWSHVRLEPTPTPSQPRLARLAAAEAQQGAFWSRADSTQQLMSLAGLRGARPGLPGQRGAHSAEGSFIPS